MSWLKSKIKMVALRASETLAQAADIVAPTLYESRVEEFHHRWQTVTRFLESIMNRELDPAEQRRLLLDSHTKESLQKLVLLVYAEENASDRMELTLANQQQAELDSTQQQPRECLEYLLEKQILPHLCDAGKRDQPSGMMSLSMQFVGALLSRVNYPLLPTREVHVSVVALIQAATKKEVEDPVVRKCLINLLNVLWRKLRCDPVQTEFFFHQATRLSIHKTGSGPSSDYTLQASTAKDSVSDFVLFTALLPHMFALGKTGHRCREALAIAAGVHEPTLCRFILTLTPFCHYIVNGIIAAYDALPKAGGAPSSPSSAGADVDTQGMEGQLELLAVRLRFCCTLAMVGRFELEDEDDNSRQTSDDGTARRTSITNELLTQFQTRFLAGPLVDALLDTSEATSRTATLYARIMLEELASCCAETAANPLLSVFVQFLVDHTQGVDTGPTASSPETEELSAVERLPRELLHRMDALSPSLSIAAIDLYTSLLELQDSAIDTALLGPFDEEAAKRRRSSGALSPRSATSVMWFASRFPSSTVAAFAHLWKLQGFGGHTNDVEASLAAGSADDSDTSEDQVVSLLSYIADAEYAACRRVPDVDDDSESSEDEDQEAEAANQLSPETTATANTTNDAVLSPTPTQRTRRVSDKAKGSERTAAARNASRPLREAQLSISIPSFSPVATRFRLRALPTASTQATTTTVEKSDTGMASSELTLFMRIVLTRLERVLESSFQENLALSGLLSAMAQKERCVSFVFDLKDKRPAGQSVRSVLEDVYADAARRIARLPNGHSRVQDVRRKLVEENGDHALNSLEPETRLLCGFVVVEEMLKELCSLLFARERVKNLPLHPEGYYLEPKQHGSASTWHVHAVPGESLPSDGGFSPRSTSSSVDNATSAGLGSEPPRTGSIGKEFEQLIAEAESKMESLLVSTHSAEQSQ
ncbi:TPA: hypothetical protein N0F65_003396 [Lagenidium giganteum]|uniref:FHF complex subunit HOOK-interacting protein C-terminal domain-containing protein n=1 Tax=Lagenidium giganteum TaxID=4803 RepID=A0AAV2YVV5_9STRA|nr:TPA: hypothetical protein N0F65_003396 [Lagenidium giganteum]